MLGEVDGLQREAGIRVYGWASARLLGIQPSWAALRLLIPVKHENLVYSFSLSGLGADAGSGRQRKLKKNTISCCIPETHILLLEVGRGGNSHQSETNLTKKTPEAKTSPAPPKLQDVPDHRVLAP